MRKIIGWMLVSSTVMSVGACQMPDPISNESKWNFTGANNANLATMLDDPMDLVQGQSDGHNLGASAVAPIMRLRRDQVKQLPEMETTQGLAPSGSSSGQSGGVPAEVQ